MKGEQLWRWSLVGSLALLGGAVLSVGTAAVNATSAMFAPVAEPVAVVNLETLINLLDERAQREQELQAFGTELDNKVKAIRDQLRSKAEELETVGDARRSQLFEEIVRLRANLTAEEQYATTIANERLTRLKRDLYQKVLTAVEQYAEQAGYSLIISNDAGAPFPPLSEGLGALESSMVNRKVLYARDTVDITQAVANRMNTDYKSSTGNR
jgi:Skp family chaperone for outer membrane proteins